MKKRTWGSLAVALFMSLSLLAACAPKARQFRATFFTVDGVEVFDTVFQVMAYDTSQAAFDKNVEEIKQLVLKYHQLFDYYHDYQGINNIKTINDQAGKEAVKVEPEIMAMLKQARQLYDKAGQKTNIAMGTLTELWHRAREQNASDLGITIPDEDIVLPDPDALAAAKDHMDFSKIKLDEAASTVFLEDPDMKIDVGAFAKGYATELVAKAMAEKGMDQCLMSSGGNIKSFGPPEQKDKKTWTVGVTDPLNPKASLEDVVLSLTGKESVVSSGNYERFFTYKGKRYHHLIDPATGEPGGDYAQVTVLAEDSGLADFLSTSLYLLPQAEGEKLAKELKIGVLWVYPDGRQVMNEAFKQALVK